MRGMSETSRTPIELCASNLRLIPPGVAVPSYDRRHDPSVDATYQQQ